MEHITRLHRCIADSKVATGIFIGSNSPGLAELLVNGTDLDWFATDLQHASIPANDSANLLRAVQAADPEVTPFVRLPDHSVYWIQQSLDSGYTGLIVPLVESADEARQLVRAAYFPPIGDRSSAGSIRSYLYGMEPDTVNDKLILLPQIESAKGLENTEEILAVEGVSGVLLGPEDLSLSCGWRGKDLWSFQPFMNAIERVITACRKENKLSSILTGGYNEAREAGFDIIGFGSDLAYTRTKIVDVVNSTIRELRGKK